MPGRFIQAMKQANVTPPFTNVQQELLELFATDVPEEHLEELKTVIGKFLLEKARDQADAVWDEREYGSETIEKLLNGNY